MKYLMYLIFALFCHSVFAERGSQMQALLISADTSFLRSESKLEYAAKDVERLAKALKDAGEVPAANISVLNNPRVEQVFQALKNFKSRTKKFLIYYSGHSTDKGLHFKDGLLSRVRFHELLKDVTAPTKIVLLDSCFSGGLKQKGAKKSGSLDVVDFGLDEPTGSVILTSSSGTEFSYESQDMKGSIFTYHLVSGLYGQADANKDGLVTVDELYQYVYGQTKFQSLVSRGVSQNPEFQNRLSGRGALVVSFPAKQNGILRLDKELKGELTLVAANGLTFFKFYKVKGQPKQISLPQNDYQLTLVEGGQVGANQVSIKTGRTRKVSSTDLSWDKLKDAPVTKKGVQNQFLFGLALGSHTGFGPNEKGESVSELFVVSPARHFWQLNWRLVGKVGGNSSQVTVQQVTRKREMGRYSLGFEASMNGISGWNNRFTGGLNFGKLSYTEFDDTKVKRSFTHLSIGSRFNPVSWPIQWGFELGVDSTRNELKQPVNASTFKLYLAY